MIKSPIQEPYFFDTKKGIDHFVKVAVEENPKKLDPKELKEIKDLGNDMKKSAYELHARSLKQFDGHDPKSYPSNPVQRGKLLEMGKLEKDLDAAKINYGVDKKLPVKRRNYWDATMELNKGNKGELKLPKLTAEEIERAKRPSNWEVIYGSMSPFEKGQWNAQQRKEKLEKVKEFEEEKRQKRIDNHTKRQRGIADKKLADLPIIKGNINYQKIPNQDLKKNMRKWIAEADAEKKKEVTPTINKPDYISVRESIINDNSQSSMPSLEVWMATKAPVEKELPGITGLSQVKRFKNTADFADQKFPKRSRGIGPFLTGEDI